VRAALILSSHLVPEWGISRFILVHIGVAEGREFRFRGDLYSQESTFPLVDEVMIFVSMSLMTGDYYPRESFREGLCNHRRWFVCPSVCLFVTTITK